MCRDRHPNLSVSTPAYYPIDLFYHSRMSVSPSSGGRFMERAENIDVAVNVEASSETPVC